MQYNNIGKFIRANRLKLNQTLNNFAINNNIEPAILSRIENGKQDIKLGVLNKIAKGFSLKASELLIEYEKSISNC